MRAPDRQCAIVFMMGYEGSTRTGTRTQDQLVKSQLLYQLSYPRIDAPAGGAEGLVDIRSACKRIIEIFPQSFRRSMAK